mgnify:CR=1 FL=1
MTLMNTQLEVSMPGFMKIDYLDQIRKEQKIGGGGCAAIYKGVILDNSLKQVSFFFSFFLLFGK